MYKKASCPLWCDVVVVCVGVARLTIKGSKLREASVCDTLRERREGIVYFILTCLLIYHHGRDSILAIAVGRDLKGKVSLVFYAVAIPLAFVNSWFACALYVLVAIVWLIPARRIENTLTS
jgi:hypothetical protein